MKTLKKLQANTYLLVLKTHGCHWNVKGPHFQSLHVLFSDQYNEMFLAVDVISERIKALDKRALASAEEFLEESLLGKKTKDNWKDMLKDLVKDHEILISVCKDLAKEAEKEGDQGTQDLAIERLQSHEKHRWMLKSHLE